eukprot:COSAG01_NODE_25559_length_741_cov_0.632399_1_plen_135_part_10
MSPLAPQVQVDEAPTDRERFRRLRRLPGGARSHVSAAHVVRLLHATLTEGGPCHRHLSRLFWCDVRLHGRPTALVLLPLVDTSSDRWQDEHPLQDDADFVHPPPLCVPGADDIHTTVATAAQHGAASTAALAATQ